MLLLAISLHNECLVLVEGDEVSLIHEDLEIAEEHLARALSKILEVAGCAATMPCGRKWIGSWAEARMISRNLLSVRAIAKKVKRLETPKQEIAK